MQHKPGSLEESVQHVLLEAKEVTIELEKIKLTTPEKVASFTKGLKKFKGVSLSKVSGTSAFIKGSPKSLNAFLRADAKDGGFGMGATNVDDVYPEIAFAF